MSGKKDTKTSLVDKAVREFYNNNPEFGKKPKVGEDKNILQKMQEFGEETRKKIEHLRNG